MLDVKKSPASSQFASRYCFVGMNCIGVFISSKLVQYGCVSPRNSCPKFAAADCVRCTNYSAVVSDSPLSAAVSKHNACRC